MLSVLNAVMGVLGSGIVIALLLLPFSLPACGTAKSKHKSRARQSQPSSQPSKPQKATLSGKKSDRLPEGQQTNTEGKRSPGSNEKVKLERTQSNRSRSNKSKEKMNSDPVKPRAEKKETKQKESKVDESSDQKKDEKTDLEDKKTTPNTNLSTDVDTTKDKGESKPEKEDRPVEKKSPPPIVNEDLVKKEFLDNSARRKRQEKDIEDMGSAHEMDEEKSSEIDANKQLVFKETECKMYYTNAKSVDWMDKVAKGIPVEKKQPKKKVVLKEEDEEDENNNNII